MSATSAMASSMGGGATAADGGTSIAGSSSSRSVAISRKVSRLLDVTVNDQLWQMLQYVSDNCPESSVASGGGGASQRTGAGTHRPVKAVLEDKVLSLHQAYLERFEKLRNGYDHVERLVDSLDSTSAAMEASLVEHRAQSEELLASAGLLRAELEEVRQKEAQVKRFLEQYSLTPEETTLLRSGDIDAAFLDTLHKVRSIHRSCKDLLVSNHQQAAVEIMETMYLLHATAVDRLVKHLLNTVSETMAHDIPDVTNVLIGCVRAVEDRPAHWAKVMHEIARVRKTAVLRRYYDLLTKGNARTGRPLETLSSDAVRFFGDLFAWLHQSLAEESDLLDSFISPQASSPLSGSESDAAASRVSVDSGSVASVTKADLMDLMFEVLCKHIKARLETALDQRKMLSGGHLHTLIVTFYQLEGTFAYFSAKTNAILGSSAALSTLLTNGKLDVLRTFYDLLKYATQRLAHVRVRGDDISVPVEVQELLRVLKSMMDNMDMSLVVHADRDGEFAPVLGAVVDPILAMLQNQSELDDARRMVLKINVLSSVQATMTGYSFTAQRQKSVNDAIAAETNTFVDWSTARLLSNFGFDDERIKQQPAVAWNVLQQTYSYTATAGALSMAHLDRVQNVRLREAAAQRITENVCAAYDALYHATPEVAGVDRSMLEPRKLRVMLDASGK